MEGTSRNTHPDTTAEEPADESSNLVTPPETASKSEVFKIPEDAMDINNLDLETLLTLREYLKNRSTLAFNDFYFTCNGKRITCEEEVPEGMPIHLHLKLLGGKGGFGSMLRAIGAQIEKTTNREACRDLSGRRLRDINEERKLKNWIARKEEREKEAKERKKQRLERMCQEPKVEFDDKEYEKQRSNLVENIADSLDKGFKAASSVVSCEPGPSGISSKRKNEFNESKQKKIKSLMLEVDLDDLSSSEGDESDAEKSDTSSTQFTYTHISVPEVNKVCGENSDAKTVD